VATVKASDNSWGFNLGAMFQLAPETRLGVSYRSSIKYHLKGTVAFTDTAGLPAPILAAIPDGDVSADIKMPDSASIALQHKLDPRWTLLADVTANRLVEVQGFDDRARHGCDAEQYPGELQGHLARRCRCGPSLDDAWVDQDGASPLTKLLSTTLIAPHGCPTTIAYGCRFGVNTTVEGRYARLRVRALFIRTRPSTKSWCR